MQPNIKEKRAEILKLIARFNEGARAPTRAARSRSSERAPGKRQHTARPASERERRRFPLGADGQRRAPTHLDARLARLEAALPATGVLELLERLERRLSRIEIALERGGRGTPLGQISSSGPDPSSDDFTLTGRLQDGLLCDMLQLVSSNTLTGVFVVEVRGVEISMYFDEGDICHAEGPDLEGEAAFFAMMSFHEGRYYFRETDDLPAKRTVQAKTQFLILEALRRADEAQAEESHG